MFSITPCDILLAGGFRWINSGMKSLRVYHSMHTLRPQCDIYVHVSWLVTCQNVYSVAYKAKSKNQHCHEPRLCRPEDKHELQINGCKNGHLNQETALKTANIKPGLLRQEMRQDGQNRYWEQHSSQSFCPTCRPTQLGISPARLWGHAGSQ